MKNWFNNLESKYKILMHVILCLAFFIMPSCINDNTNTFVYIIWLAIMVIEIIFIVWHIQYKKQGSSKVEEKDEDIVEKNGSSPQPTPVIVQKTKAIKSNEESFICDLELKCDNKAISSFIKTFIDGGWYSKDELYEGMTNKEIEEAGYEVYQLKPTTYDAQVKFFEGSNSIGVYVNDYDKHSKYFAVVPSEERDNVRKILFFDKNTKCSLLLEGGKYKEYDYEEEKVIVKESDYSAKLFIIYTLNADSEEKMNNILDIEKANKKKMKLFNPYIAGVTFNNDDGSNRKEILATLQPNEELKLEQYLYEGSKAVRILTQKGQMVGNIPKDLAEMIYDAIEKNAVYMAMYDPEYYDGHISQHCIRLLLK